MRERVLSGVVIAAVLAVCLPLGGFVLWGVLLAVSVIAFFELTGAMGVRKKGTLLSPPEIVCLVGLLMVYLGLKLTLSISIYVVAGFMTLIGLFFVYVFAFPRINSRDIVKAFFCFAYGPCMLSFIYLLRALPHGAFMVWLPFVAWVSDTCAYFAGRAFGKRKLAPALSPAKTIEGAIGGVLGAVVAGALFGLMVSFQAGNFHLIWVFMIVSGLSSFVSQVGDLAASGIKRDNKIKDYGRLIPGHGGIMDRFDSVIMVSPIIYFLTFLVWSLMGITLV